MLRAERLEVDLRRVELLQVLRAAELRGLLLELQLGDLLAQRLAGCCSMRQALLVGAAQPRRSGRRTRCAARRAPPRARA